MSSAEPVQHAADAVREEVDRYAHGEDRPLGGYAALLGVYSTVLAVLGAVVRRRGGLPQRLDARDLALLGVATHKLSRLITKGSVTGVVRAPFASFGGPSGEGEVHDEVRGEGFRHAAGELVTCPFCAGMWVGTLLAFGLVIVPRPARMAASILTVVTGSDFLQLAYAIAQRAAHGD